MDYRAVYVVSDLHLGGYTGVYDASRKDWTPFNEPGAPPPGARSFRIFRDAEALAWAIDNAGAGPKPVALVLNGDIVDFLAMPDAKGFDPDGARAMLERIVTDREQQLVWQALRRFVAVSGTDLVLVLGNHDVELAMHDASALLVEYLTEGVEERAPRIIHCYDGNGFSCSVGGGSVLAVHGNAVDPWNQIDYSLLARYAEARRLKARRPAFRVNAGSTLVVEHMNKVKRRYQWIDLLKPEQQGAALAAAALDKDQAAPISLMVENFFTRGFGMARAVFVSEEAEAAAAPRRLGRSHDEAYQPIDTDALLRDAQEKDAAGISPVALVESDDRDSMLSALEVLPGLVKLKMGRSLREVFRDYLPQDRSFDSSATDETYRDLDRITDPKIDFLIAGHTHLERSLRRRHGSGHYFNSGTWIKLVSIPTETLASDEAFVPVSQALEEGSMDALERVDESPFAVIKSIRTVVKIEALSGGGARGVLCHVVGQSGAFALEEMISTARTTFAQRVHA